MFRLPKRSCDRVLVQFALLGKMPINHGTAALDRETASAPDY